MRPQSFFTSSLVLTLGSVPAWAGPQSCPAAAAAHGSTAATVTASGGGTCTASTNGTTVVAAQGAKAQAGCCAAQTTTAAKGSCCAGATAAPSVTCQETTGQVPVLGSIPVLGQLFQKGGEPQACAAHSDASPYVVQLSQNGLQPGTYEVRTTTGQDGTFQVVGPDGHVIQGTVVLPARSPGEMQVFPAAGSVGSKGETISYVPAGMYGVQAGQGSERGYIGIVPEIGDGAMTITSVFPDSPASQAGLRAGDRIVQVGGEPVGDDVMERLAKTKPGEELSIRVDRDGWTRDLTLTLSAANPSWGIPGSVTPPSTSGQGASGGLARIVEDDDEDVDEADEDDEADEADEDAEEVEENDDDDVSVFTFGDTTETQGEEHDAHGQHHVRVLRPGAGEHGLRIEVQGDENGTPHVLEWSGEAENGEGGAWTTEAHGHTMTKTIEIPGGKCQVQVIIEGDGKGEGAHVLHGMLGGGSGLELFTEEGDGSGEQGQAKCCEGCQAECCKEGAAKAGAGQDVIVLQDRTTGTEDAPVRRRITMRAPGGGERVIERSIEIPDVASKVRSELRARANAQPRMRSPMGMGGGGSGSVGAGPGTPDINELRGQIEELRQQLHELLESIEAKSGGGGGGMR
jgi:hypothetical protein